MTDPSSSTKKARLLEGPVGPTLFRLALPMSAGVFAMMMFHIMDTFFVGKLGSDQLAAMGFTFPIAHLIQSLALGLMVGTSTVLARLIGSGAGEQVRRITTDALLLSALVILALGGIGLLTIQPLFQTLGADDHIIGYIRQYMVPYYAGVAILVIPMVANGAIRATGDTLYPSLIMITASLVNIVLDPLLIFRLGPFPRLELRGAAFASIGSWVISFIAALWILGKREHMLARPCLRIASLIDSWKRILYMAVPVGMTNLVIPLSAAILTRIFAGFGPEAVAGFAVGGRVEMLALIGPFALTAGLSPFVGQNFGAGQCDRVRAGMRLSVITCWCWGLGACLVLGLFARPIAGLFTSDPAIIRVITAYLWIVPISYGGMTASFQVTTTLNAVNKPLLSTAISVTRMFVITLPLAWLGSSWLGVGGAFAGLMIGNLMIGLLAYAFIQWYLARLPGESPTTIVEGELSAVAKAFEAETGA